MHHLTHSWTARDPCQRIRKQAYEHLILRGRFFLRNGAIGPLELSNMSSLCRHLTPSGGSSGFGARSVANRSVARRRSVANWAHERAHEKALLTYFRSRAMRTMCGWRRSGKSTSVGLTS